MFRKSEHAPASGSSTDTVFRNSEQDDDGFRKSEQLAAELLDEAFTRAGLDTKEIAHLCGVSASLVDKWRDPQQRGCPSFIQLLLLPPAFHVALHKVMSRRFGFGRAALLDLLEAAGALAVAQEV